MSLIKSLKALDFTKVIPTRDAKIDAAPAELPKKASEYVPNQIAAILHPASQHVVISKITPRGEHFKTFELVSDKEAGTEFLAPFVAGQYISVEFDADGKHLVRPYSLCNYENASKLNKYEITLERVPGGLASNFAHDNWKVGDKLNISAPLGNFTYEPLRDAKHILALVGGSSITPIYSLAQAISEGAEDAESLTIIYGSRTFADTLYQEELSALAASSPKVALVNVFSDEEREGAESGFITADIIKKYAPKCDYSLFICGPAPMQDFLAGELSKLGLPKRRIRSELFGEPHGTSRFKEYKAPEAKSFKMQVLQETKKYEIEISSEDTLLQAMEKAGIAAPSHCRSGECGFCHSRLISGDVFIPKMCDGRREADKIYGFIHPCATFALSELTIEIPPFKL